MAIINSREPIPKIATAQDARLLREFLELLKVQQVIRDYAVNQFSKNIDVAVSYPADPTNYYYYPLHL